MTNNKAPLVSEKTKNGEVFYDIQSRLIKDRIIFLSEAIDNETAAMIIPLLFMMDNEDHEKKISLWIHSPGGDTGACAAIADMMQIIKAPVETICVGEASSGGAILMAAGDKGTRSCTPNSRFMIHQVQVGGLHGDTVSGLERTLTEIKNINDKMLKLLSIHTGQSLEKVKKDCEHDLYLTPKQAVEYGLVDRIIPYSKQLPVFNSEGKKITASKLNFNKKTLVTKRIAKKATKK